MEASKETKASAPSGVNATDGDVPHAASVTSVAAPAASVTSVANAPAAGRAPRAPATQGQRYADGANHGEGTAASAQQYGC